MFPLRLTSFEELFFREDSLQYPQTFAVIWQFDRPLNLDTARHALSRALPRHPLMTTRIRLNQAGDAEFHPCSELPRLVDLECDDLDQIDMQIDPCREPAIRLFYRNHSGKPELLWVFHHCVVDGIGSSQLMQDWFANYQFLESKHKGHLKQHRLDDEALTMRCRPNLSFKEALGLLPGQWLSIRGTIRFFGRKVIPLVPLKDWVAEDPKTTFSKLTFCNHTFDTDITSKIREYAQANQATVNSLLIRELFLAIKDWQQSHADNMSGTHWRISVPVNERTIKHRRMSACNHCSIVSIDRCQDELRDQVSLLSGIQSQMDAISKWRLSLNMWRILSLMQKLKRKEKPGNPTLKCRSTCVLSNVGDASQRMSGARMLKGRDDVTRVIGCLPSLPIRWGTPVAITAFYFENSLNISLRYDANLLDEAQASQLLETYCGLLQQRAEHG